MTSESTTNRTSMLSIRQASQMLGVSEPTLRQWTDEGKIKAFVTPGGHRRYSESELRHFMGDHSRVHGIRDLVARIELAPAQEVQIAQTHFSHMPWYNNLDGESRIRLAELGRRMHRIVISHVSSPRKRIETIESAREVGREFGAHLVRIGLSLTDSLEAFLLHRSPLVHAATDLLKGRETLNEQAAEAVPLVTEIIDAALISLVEAYQENFTRSLTGESEDEFR